MCLGNTEKAVAKTEGTRGKVGRGQMSSGMRQDCLCSAYVSWGGLIVGLREVGAREGPDQRTDRT